jgi:hypothetical protein
MRMRRYHVALVVLLVVCGGALTRADELPVLLWDNFLATSDGFDPNVLMTSEKDATVSLGGSWTADDVDFTSFGGGVTIQKLRWAGALLDNRDYTVEVTILKNDLNYTQLAAISIPTFNILDTFGSAPGGYLRYVADVTLPELGFHLDPGKYFVGIRLLSTNGRNFMAGRGALNPQGHAMGIFKSAYWGYPNWIPIDQFATYQPEHPYLDPTDFAFQVYGIPEPAALLLIGGGVLFLRRR